MKAYTSTARKEWVKDNLERIESQGLSYRDIALEIKHLFGLSKPVSTATIQRDLQFARDTGIQPYSPEAMRLLEPDNFAEFRELFPAPGGGVYQTNETHLALYWVMYALSRKVDLPDWVIKHFELPEDINDDIVEKNKLLTFILLMAPRHGKTMTVIHGLIVLICAYPDVRIMYGQGVLKTSQKAMSLIMSEMEHNEKLKALYGPFRDDDKPWSRNDGFTVARRKVQAISPTFTPIGINVNVRSLDADIIIIDDPQDLDRAESEATTTRDYRTLTTEIMTRREAHTPVLMIGSHLPTLHGDVFTQLEDNIDNLQTEGQAIIMRKRMAHDLDRCKGGPEHWDCLEWPEYRDWDFLQSQRALLGDDMFEAVYQQVSRIPGARPFPPKMVKGLREDGGILDLTRSWKETLKTCPRDGGTLYTGLGFDPAAGETKKASYSALAVGQGCIKCRTIYLIDYWEKRQSPELHAGTIIEFARAFNVGWVKVEINAYQKALARDHELTEGSRKYRFNIDEHRTDDRKNTPEFGIPNLGRYMRDDKFSVPYQTFEDQNYAKDLQSALIRYPLKPNDTPMALWLMASMIWEIWELYTDQEPIVIESYRRNTPAYMLNKPMRVDLSKVVRDWG